MPLTFVVETKMLTPLGMFENTAFRRVPKSARPATTLAFAGVTRVNPDSEL